MVTTQGVQQSELYIELKEKSAFRHSVCHFSLSVMHDGKYCLVSDHQLYPTFCDALWDTVSHYVMFNNSHYTFGQHYKMVSSLCSAVVVSVSGSIR